MTRQQMMYLLALEEEKRIYKAADKCFISQSAFSQQLAKIEEKMGIPIFRRQDRDWVPTEYGEVLLDGCRQILDIYSTMNKRFAQITDSMHQTINLAIPASRAENVFPYIYSRFEEKFPNHKLNLVEASIREIPSLLVDGRADLGLTFAPKYIHYKYRHLLRYSILCNEEIVLVCPKGHHLLDKLSENGRLDIGYLNGEELIAFHRGFLLHNIIDRVLKQNGVRYQEVMNFESVETSIRFILKTNVPYIISNILVKHLSNHPQLTIVRFNPPISNELGLIMSNTRKPTDVECWVAEITREAFHRQTL